MDSHTFGTPQVIKDWLGLLQGTPDTKEIVAARRERTIVAAVGGNLDVLSAERTVDWTDGRTGASPRGTVLLLLKVGGISGCRTVSEASVKLNQSKRQLQESNSANRGGHFGKTQQNYGRRPSENETKHKSISGVYGKSNADFTMESCPPPSLALNGTQTEEGDVRIRDEYRLIREVKFSGAIGPLGEKRLCKIKCIGGQWVGPLCVNEDEPENGRFQPLFRSCKLEYINPHLVVTFRNVSIQTAGWVFPHGAKLQIRCRELGLYKPVGMATPRCQNGGWSHKLPSCVPTTLLTNFTEDAPPTILIKIPSGSASIEPTGLLAVFPGSTLHLECLFSRRLGSPDWTWTSPLGQYLTGNFVCMKIIQRYPNNVAKHN
ncbi:locomotion-related protein Hikaru genki-like [Photinus pyralis]|uniref:locomotion-related protein Hikaru genki-like n=1 Tax=Photinus pyralis TaxID=7054 RepID=UPI001266EC95|nr:locomotion-related protein Hikaru genki-like [Photinus pyralis]